MLEDTCLPVMYEGIIIAADSLHVIFIKAKIYAYNCLNLCATIM